MTEETLSFSSPRYSLTLPADRPFVYLEVAGREVASLFLPASVHSLHGLDDTAELGSWQVERLGEETIFTLPMRSSLWAEKHCRLRCSPSRLRYELEVTGRGRLTEVTYFGGYCSARPRWGSGQFLSGHNFTEGFNPEPNTDDAYTFAPESGTVIDLTGAPLPGKRHWSFTPAPFCFALRAGDTWLGLGVEAEPGRNSFSEYRYHGRGGFYLSLAYDGATAVEGTYQLPAIGFDFGADQWEVLGAHVHALRTAGLAPVPSGQHPAWWRQPMFCGWGAQCREAAAFHAYQPTGPEAIDHTAFLATIPHAASFARQEVYDGFLAALAERQIVPGTVVLDDKWQATYGENEVDRDKWPDLPGFIAARHTQGQHVLLWLKAWDREGVPAEECITNAAGLPLSVDPTNPRFEQRLRASVRRMLSPQGYDADGFKIDFTHRIPSGPSLSHAGQQWGLELMRHYLGIIHHEAKRTKPEALIMTHTPHPYLADVVDMIRLNDMLDLTTLHDPAAGHQIERTVSWRARIAGIACPEALIDTDNWPVRNKALWRRYVALQGSLGVPSLYFATHIDLTQEALDEEDYQAVREAWRAAGAR